MINNNKSPVKTKTFKNVKPHHETYPDSPPWSSRKVNSNPYSATSTRIVQDLLQDSFINLEEAGVDIRDMASVHRYMTELRNARTKKNKMLLQMVGSSLEPQMDKNFSKESSPYIDPIDKFIHITSLFTLQPEMGMLPDFITEAVKMPGRFNNLADNLPQKVDELKETLHKVSLDGAKQSLSETFNTFKTSMLNCGINPELLRISKGVIEMLMFISAYIYHIRNKSWKSFALLTATWAYAWYNFADMFSSCFDMINLISMLHVPGSFESKLEKVFSHKTQEDADHIGKESAAYMAEHFEDRDFKFSGSPVIGQRVREAVSNIQMEEITEEEESLRPEMGDDEISTFVDVATVGLCTFISGAKPTKELKLLSFVKDFSNCQKGLGAISKVVINMVQKISDYVRQTFMDLPAIQLISSNYQVIDEYGATIRKVCFLFHQHRFPMNDANYSRLCDLEMAGVKLQMSLRRDPSTSGIIQELTEQLRNIRVLKLNFERSNYHYNGPRQEPVGVRFIGGPGVGKSVSLATLATELATQTLQDDDFKEYLHNPGTFIYNRCAENIYWDSYTSRHLVCTIDDFGQAKDIAGSPDNEFMNLLRAINVFEYNLHSAGMEEKGKLNFNCKFVAVSTNTPKIAPNSVISAEAIQRRFNFSYIVIPREEYELLVDGADATCLMSKKMNKDALPVKMIRGDHAPDLAGLKISDLTPACQWFVPVTPSGEPTGEAYKTFEEVVAEVMAQYHVNRARYELNRENHEDITRRSLTDKMSQDEIDDYKEMDSELEDDGFVSYYDEMPEWADELMSMTPYLLGVQARNEWLKGKSIQYIYNYFILFCPDDKEREKLRDQKDFFWPRTILRIQKHRPVSTMDKLEKALQKIPGYASVVNILKIVSKPCLVAFVAIGGGSVFFYLGKLFYRWWFGKEYPEPESHGHSDKMKTSLVKAKYIGNPAAMKAAISGPLAPQMGADKSGIDLSNSIMKSNLFRLFINENGEWESLNQILFVKGRIALLPYHVVLNLFSRIANDSEIVDKFVKIVQGYGDNERAWTYKVRDLIMGHQVGALQQYDYCLVEFPKGKMQPRRDIVENFALREDFDHVEKNIPFILYTTHEGAKSYVMGHSTAIDVEIPLSSNFTGDYKVRKSYKYMCNTGPGDCGSPMIVLNNRLTKRKIFGAHIAGDTNLNQGYASSLCQEDLLEDLTKFEEQYTSIPVPVDLVPECTAVLGDNRFNYLGEMTKTPSRINKVDIVKSNLYGTYAKPLTKVSRTRPFVKDEVEINPLDLAQKKFCTPDVYIDPLVLDKVGNSYWAWHDHVSTYDVSKNVFSIEEAIYGIDEDYFDGIASSTSAGYPMTVAGNINLKKELFLTVKGSDEWKIVMTEIEKLVDEAIDLMKKKIRPVWLFADGQKVERVAKEKADAGKCRLFCGNPFILLIISRMYYGRFSQHFMLNRVRNSSAVGVNPASQEWDTIARMLSEFDVGVAQVGAGDYKGFDASEKPQIHFHINEGIKKWYDDGVENNIIRDILFLEVTNSRHIIDGHVFEWVSSLPSGHFLTTTLNCIYNCYAFRWCWYRAFGSLKDYNDYCRLIVLGDDNAFSVGQRFRDKFNEMTIAPFMAEIGLTYTPEIKDTVATQKFRNIGDIEFLKRGFHLDKTLGVHLGPLRLDVVKEIPFWTKKGSDRDNILVANVETALSELCLHTPEVYQRWLNPIANAFDKHYSYLTPHKPLRLSQDERREFKLSELSFY